MMKIMIEGCICLRNIHFDVFILAIKCVSSSHLMTHFSFIHNRLIEWKTSFLLEQSNSGCFLYILLAVNLY
jgi:hypothetical protein